MTDNSPTISDLHRLALAIGWPRAEVHALLHDWCLQLWPGTTSLKDLSPEQRIVFADQIRASGGNPKLRVYKQKPRKRPGRPAEPGVIRMASPGQKQLIKTVASEMRWSASLLNDFLRTHFQCEDVEQIGSSARACKAIQLLKAYKGKKERSRQSSVVSCQSGTDH